MTGIFFSMIQFLAMVVYVASGVGLLIAVVALIVGLVKVIIDMIC